MYLQSEQKKKFSQLILLHHLATFRLRLQRISIVYVISVVQSSFFESCSCSSFSAMMQLCPFSAQAAAADPKYEQNKGESIISRTVV